MHDCPKCGSPRIHRSRSRGWWEKARKGFTNQRPHRCHACGWRGWGRETGHHTARVETVPVALEGPDVQAVDAAVDRPAEGQGRAGGN